MKTRSACIVCNGEVKNSKCAKLLAKEADLLIAADGGANHLSAWALKPSVIVGDMDSLSEDAWREARDIIRIPYMKEKDKSDTELALEYAFSQGCEHVVLLAASGGRLDHTLVNVALVAGHPGRVALLDGDCLLTAIDNRENCCIRGEQGSMVSLIPYRDMPVKLKTAGLKYPLCDEPFAYITQGVGNQLVQERAEVEVAEGVLLVYCKYENLAE
jgi:thiamine pyrophosphokinase